MNWPRLLLRLFGHRLPRTTGTVEVGGLEGPLWIGRDRFGVPHIRATSDLDGWFGLGFCQGQDRAFQLETRARLVRGTLAALVGSDGLPMDRLSRRIGFARAAIGTLDRLTPQATQRFDAFAAGVNAGVGPGGGGRAHEFVLLRSKPITYTAADAVGFLAVQSFALASNWDTELARLRMLELDGPQAVADLHPPYAEQHPVSDRPGASAGRVVDALAADLERSRMLFEAGGGSNNWALDGSKTASGRPILANDPHLAPLLPAHWYLAHVSTPEWTIAGGSIPGTPGFGFGHNDTVAWGVTAGLIDTTDLFIEEVGPDARSVRRGEHFIACDVRTETISVRGGDPMTIEVLETDRGPIVGPAFDGPFGALSMATTWLDGGDVGAILDIGRHRSFDDLHNGFREWRSAPLNIAYADEGSVGYQLIGSAPERGSGSGVIPQPAADETTRWTGRVAYDDLPKVHDPESGFVATANNLPASDGPYLGSDFLDGYRAARISERLAETDDWTVAKCLELQMDRVSIPWREMRDTVLAAADGAPTLREPAGVLREWDGTMDSESIGAALFAAFTARLCERIASSRAPESFRFALGAGFSPLVPFNSLLVRRVSHLIGLLDERPDGWFDEGWDDTIRSALTDAVELLRDHAGTDPAGWTWGSVRPLTLVHPMGLRPPLDRIWNIGPLPHGGDANTVNPGPVDPLDPLGNSSFAIASARMVVEIGAWDSARFCLPGGQSGNPYSRHYADQVPLWLEGDALVIPTSTREVERVVRRVVELVPAAN